MKEKDLRLIFEKTEGHCHFCGDALDFDKRGWAEDLDGHWEVDHVIQRAKGGSSSPDNCLPACTRCNRLRWHRTGKAVRELLLLGLIAHDQIKRGTDAGKRLETLRNQRLEKNRARRSYVGTDFDKRR